MRVLAYHRPRNGDALALAARQSDAALADQRVVSLWHLRYELMRVSQFRSANDVGAVRGC